jgi:hypothetical protein
MIPRDTPHPFLHPAVYAYARAATIRLYPLPTQQCLLPRPAEQDGHASALCVPSLLDKDGRSYSVCIPAFPISLRNISIPESWHTFTLASWVLLSRQYQRWAPNTYPSPYPITPPTTRHYHMSVTRLWLHSWTDLRLSCFSFMLHLTIGSFFHYIWHVRFVYLG